MKKVKSPIVFSSFEIYYCIMPFSLATRFSILARDNFTCQYCGAKAPDVVLEVDHKIPLCQGGKDTNENGITACYECNHGKSGRTIEQMKFRATRKREAPTAMGQKGRDLKATGNDRISLSFFARREGVTRAVALSSLNRGIVEGSTCSINATWGASSPIATSRILTKEDFFK